MADLSHIALIMVDSQIGVIGGSYYGTSRSNPSYENNVTTLLSAFRSIQGPHAPHIIHIYHSSTTPASPLHASKPSMSFHPTSLPLPSEPVFSKITNSAFMTPELGDYIKKKQIWEIYFAGLSVDLCLGSTIRHASDLKIADHVDDEGEVVQGKIYLVEDATAAWAKKNGKFDAETTHGVTVESLCPEFADVVRTDDVLKVIGYEE